ncbi:hypothetical protein FPQ18DRAFT_20847 [Pyronema domesticum]|nr:hypothetical protein FPQ18DRAFT_20847 [Pyronema domesticum]
MASKARFEKQRATIREFYLSQNKTIKQIMDIMACQPYRVEATVGQYKKRLTQWGFFQKNILKVEFIKILRLIHKRQNSGKMRSRVMYRGRTIDARRIETGLKCYKNN